MAGDKKIEKGTIYQQLNKMLNLDGFGFQESSPIAPIGAEKKSKIVIKGNTPEEIHKKGLELEQKRELQSKFFRTTDRGFQKALQYEAARLPAYIDYEGMEYYPIISSALDLFMEEATSIGLNGKMLNIYSNKDRIKSLLEGFFYDTVNVNVNLPFWVRNLPIKYDSIIPLLDGTELTIKELSERMKNNPDEEIWTYSIQDKTNNVVPGKIVWCDLTRKNSDILKINLDDNTYVETTPDHEFLLRNGTYVKAFDLNVGDSLMPYYTIESKETNLISGYEKVYNPSSNHHKFTHRLVSLELLKDDVFESQQNVKIITHHKDFNKKNNHPNNLKRMKSSDHSKLHCEYGERGKKILSRKDVVEKRMKGIDEYLRSDKRKKYLSDKMVNIYSKYFNEYNNSKLHSEHNTLRKNVMTKLWSNNNYKEKTRKLMQINLSDKSFNIIKNIILNSNDYISKPKLCNLLKNNKDFINNFKLVNKHIKRDILKSLNTTTLDRLILRKTNQNYLGFTLILKPEIINNKKFICSKKISDSKKPILNHKIVSIEKLGEGSDAYCMEVVGENNEQDRHNFPICSKDNNGNYNRNGIFVSNCKYGDNFVLLYGERKKGITHVKQLVNYEIERFERIQNGKPLVRFKERMTGDEFNVFEIAHFRLLGDDKYLPYGSCLLSDTYIKTNNGVKEIKNIQKDDIVIGFDLNSQNKIESKVLDIVHSGKKEVFKISTKHNYVDSSKEHKILIYDKKNNEFKYKFTENLKINDYLVINNRDDNNEIKYVDKKEKITVDRLKRKFRYYQNIDCIPDVITTEFAEFLGFMFGDGWVSNKKDISFALGEYDKLNSKYINLLHKFSGVKPRLYEPSIKTNLKYSQATVGSKMLFNILTDLKFYGKAKTKRIPDWIFNSSKEIREAFLDGFVDADGSLFKDKWNCIRYSIELSNENLIKDLKYLIQSLGYKSGKISHRKRHNNSYIKGRKINSSDFYYIYFFKSKNKQTKKHDIINRKTNNFIVEPIISIENIGYGDVYDIYVDNENHNFFANNVVVHNSILNKVRRVFRQLVMAEDAMLTYRIIRAGEKKVFKIDVGNIDEDDIEEYIYKVATTFKKTAQVAPNDGQIDYRFNILGNDEDYFLPVRNSNTETGIETLPGAQNLDQIHDIEYLRDNLFIGLGVPKPFLSFQDAVGGGKNMAQYDIRFSKKINRIQQAIIQELNKMAMVHLYLLGYSGEDLNSFQITLTNPSTQQELLKSELLRDKAQTYTELTRAEGGIAAMSHTTAKRLIFNMSDREIVDDLKQQKMEKVVMQELQDSPVTIKKSGLFTDIDKRFGEPIDDMALTGETEGGMPPEGAGAPPAGEEGMPPLGGDAGAPMGDAGTGAPLGGAAPMMETSLSEEEYEKHLEKLVYGSTKEPEQKKKIKQKEIIQENNKINDKLNKGAEDMIAEIDSLLENSKTINTNQKLDETQDLDIKNIEDMDLD